MYMQAAMGEGYFAVFMFGVLMCLGAYIWGMWSVPGEVGNQKALMLSFLFGLCGWGTTRVTWSE